MLSQKKENYLDQMSNDDFDLYEDITAFWKFNIRTKQLSGSKGFGALFSFENSDYIPSYDYFINFIVYHEDLPLLIEAATLCRPGLIQSIELRLFTKDGFQWFKNTFRLQSGSLLSGILVNIHEFKVSEFKLSGENNHYAILGKIARTGSWSFDSHTETIILSREACQILQLKNQFSFSLGEWVNLFNPFHQSTLNNSLNESILTGKPFELDLQCRTGTGDLLWIKVKTLPEIDYLGKKIAVKGAIQNIDFSKRVEKELKSLYEETNFRNKRLQNFSYIISHNLRSNSKNLQYLVGIHNESNHETDKKNIFGHIIAISDSLMTTINYLEEIVNIKFDFNKQLEPISFASVFDNVVKSLSNQILGANAVINRDFTAYPYVRYLSSYLESILHNFLTNSLKYRHPSRQLVISCKSSLDNGFICLIFEDNGMGIDLQRYGQNIFGLHQTFHQNADSKGIGLFITKNQVESLGGDIVVDSKVGVGTKFIVKLMKYKAS